MPFERISLGNFTSQFTATAGEAIPFQVPFVICLTVRNHFVQRTIQCRNRWQNYLVLGRILCRSIPSSSCRSEPLPPISFRIIPLTACDKPPPSLKGQFGPKGALFSGWETRRHNPNYDWYVPRSSGAPFAPEFIARLGCFHSLSLMLDDRCILKLGTKGTVVGFDIDTTHFNGKSNLRTFAYIPPRDLM
jgi:hypothetical protein